MPVRLGLLPLIPSSERERWLRSVEELHCDAVMTTKPTTVKDGAKLSYAIKLMNREKLKRLPVTDDHGVVTGMLSRIDILRTIAVTHGPECAEAESSNGTYSRYVKEIKDRDNISLNVDITMKTAIDALVASGSQRAAVIEPDGRLVGIITDELLLRAIGGQIRSRLAFGMVRRARLSLRPISDIMLRNIRFATEVMTIYEALCLMTELGLKRIPVVDAKGVFTGMIRRDSILLEFSHLWESSSDPAT
jgi:CBS domain-containing protein